MDRLSFRVMDGEGHFGFSLGSKSDANDPEVVLCCLKVNPALADDWEMHPRIGKS
jgi:hypothetical protein